MATATLKAKLTLNDALFLAGIKRATSAAQVFGVTVAKIGLDYLRDGMFAAGRAFITGTKGIIDAGDNLLRMKRITGISVESLFILREAFEQAGTSAESIGPTIGKMQKNIYDAAKKGGALGKELKGIGINIHDLVKMKADEQFLLFGKAINALPDMKKQAISMLAFGKAGLALLPVFAELKDFDSKGLEQQAKFMGKNAEAFDNANDAIRRMKTLSSGLFGGMAVMIAPLLERLAKAFSGVDWLAAGERIAKTVSNIVKTGMGLLSHPELIWDAFVDVAKKALPIVGELFMRALVFGVKALGHVLGKTIMIAGQMLVAIAVGMGGALIDAFMNAVAYLHAGLSYAAINFVATITKGLQQVLGALGINIGATKGTTWKDQIKKSKDTFATGGIGARGMEKGSEMMATAMNDLKTMFKGGGLAKALRAGEDENFGISADDKFPAKGRDKYGKGNWRQASTTGVLRGASMAGGLSSSIFSGGRGDIGSYSSLKGASLLGGMANGEAGRSNGLIRHGDKRRREAAERTKANEGVDKTNELLEGVKADIHAMRMDQI